MFLRGQVARSSRGDRERGGNPRFYDFNVLQGGPTSTSRTVIPPAILTVLDGVGWEDGEAGGQLTGREVKESSSRLNTHELQWTLVGLGL